jgi:molybdopterin synthase catalytic subunit
VSISSALDSDQARDLGDGLAQRLFQAEFERGPLRRARGALSEQSDPYRTRVVDTDEFDVPAIGNQGRPEPVEVAFDGVSQGISGGTSQSHEKGDRHFEAAAVGSGVMHLTVKLFGSLREEAGARELELELPEGSRLVDLRELLAARYPALERLGERVAAAVNLQMAEADDVLSEGDEVAFLPPVAGGSGEAVEMCNLSARPLVVEEVVARVTGPGAGGVVTFVGNVRDHARGRSIQHLEYEAYPEMAEREMQKIADAAGRRWPGVRVAIAHRTGHLEIGEAAVVIAASAPHRAEAFEACRFAIDTLKQTVPIWKKEVATDGEYWVDDHA